MTNTIILAYKDYEAMVSSTPVYLHDILDKSIIEYPIEAAKGSNITIIVDECHKEKFEKYSQLANIAYATDDTTAYSAIKSALNDDPTVIIDGNNASLIAKDITDFAEGCQEDGGDIVTLNRSETDYNLIYLASNTLANGCESLEELLKLQQVVEFEVPAGFESISLIVNRYELSLTEDLIREQIITEWLYRGVTIKNMDSVTIGPDVEIGVETIIYPNTYITGKVSIGEACKLGPFLRIRQKAKLADGVKIGNFVELKNTTMGKKSASAHLSYLGDTTIGEKVNIGCGVITVNYDGKNKHQTIIEDEAFIGCNTNLIAPVTVGADALVAAGSTVTKNVPAKSLCFARARQINKEGYKRPKK